MSVVALVSLLVCSSANTERSNCSLSVYCFLPDDVCVYLGGSNVCNLLARCLANQKLNTLDSSPVQQ